jgi:hypothetical protein
MSTDLSKLDSLIERQQRRGVDIRPMLLRMLTDVYVGRRDHTPEDQAQYVGIALKLIEDVDAETRRTVAQLLRAYQATPPAVLEFLSDRESAAGSGITANIAAGPRPDQDAALGQRFFAADTAERRNILAALAAGWSTPQGPAEELTRTVLSLERSALAGHPGDFIRELEWALRLPRETAERIVNDVGGEPMVVAARALAMPLAVLQRVLMFLNPAIGHSVRRVYDLSALYEDVTPAAARRLSAAWSSASAPSRAVTRAAREQRDDGSLRSVATARPSERRPTERRPTAALDRRTQRTS